MSFISEFKQFIARGNVVDMAVGVIIGGAFGKIVTSLTEDVIMPPIGMLLGKVNFSSLFVPLINDPSKMADAAEYAGKTLDLMNMPMDKVKAMGIPVIAYGNFLQMVLDFLIIAFCVFLLIKAVNKLMPKPKEEPAPAAPAVKVCPECLSEIPAEAKRCKFCTSVQPESKKDDKK
ncbi:MAG: large conductance mechanosensitive channel protein MscL [bacterium]|nr:large conductance mechanosensitive channel protein MscL [bacterium]